MVIAQHTLGRERNFLTIRPLYKVARGLQMKSERTVEKAMAAVMRVLLWALVLIAPGGILLAPVLAAHELRRRSRAAHPVGSPEQAVVPSLL